MHTTGFSRHLKTSLASLILLTSMELASACTCKFLTPEEVATEDKYEFTKLRINYPTASELWQRFKKRHSLQRPYSVTVLEDVKGRFSHSELLVEVGDGPSCGTSVSFGQTLYLLRLTSDTDEWGKSASVCNIHGEGFAQEVKKVLELKKSK